MEPRPIGGGLVVAEESGGNLTRRNKGSTNYENAGTAIMTGCGRIAEAGLMISLAKLEDFGTLMDSVHLRALSLRSSVTKSTM